ncbi:hypothetical protein M885DRAFT_549848 [Pelagophyceae sp. CCMP2097]|nr:hypothetical protein M885DRAFT_549848 [Pelagophyceae sp. CCMP2097]
MMTDLRAMATAHGHAIGAAQHAQLSLYQVLREDSDESVETDDTVFLVSRHAVQATTAAAWVDETGALTDVVAFKELGLRFKQQVGVQRRTSLRRCSCQFLANSGLWCRHMYSVAHRRNMGRLPLMAVAPFWRREEREEPAAPSAPARAAQTTQARTTPTTFESRRQSLQQLVAPLIECAARTIASTAQVTRVVTGMLATFSSVAVRVEPPATQTATATVRATLSLGNTRGARSVEICGCRLYARGQTPKTSKRARRTALRASQGPLTKERWSRLLARQRTRSAEKTAWCRRTHPHRLVGGRGPESR